MYSVYDIVVILTLSVIVKTPYVQGIKIQNATSDGHLKIQDGKVWKNLATSGLDIPATKVLCRTLGLPSDDVKRLESHQKPTFDSSTIFVNFNCVGNETTIEDCQNTTHEFPDANSTLVRIQCSGLSFDLYGGGDTDGLVMVKHNGHRVPVCLNSDIIVNNTLVASVVCRSLGFNISYPIVMYPYKYTSEGKELTRALLLELSCRGDDCELHTTNTDEYWEKSYGITYLNVLAVFCVEQDNEYRLQDKTHGGSIGRLEVKANNTWGPVCASAIGPAEACLAMGLPSTDARRYMNLYNGGEFTAGSLSMNFCGFNKDLGRACEYNMFGMPCRDKSYAGISCANATEGQIRLDTGRSGPYSGEVKIYHGGSWRGIGVDSSKTSALKEATVICRTLNFSTNGVEWSYSMFNFSLWVDDVNCVGNESTLSDCQGTSLSQTVNTTLGLSLKVSCGTRDNALRLENDGLLMMKRMGNWGTVCANGINNLEAAVICKALNKSYTLAHRMTGNNDPERTGRIWRVGFKCNTTDDDWQRCLNHRYSYVNRDCAHDNDAYIKCEELDKSTVQYRLSKGPVPKSGYVEMFVSNTWGYVCNTGLSAREAKVVCSSMNFTTNNAKVIHPKLLEPLHNGKVWLNRLQCKGTEASILDCAHSYLGDGYCRNWGDEKLAVYCGTEDTSDDFSLRIAGDSGAKSGRLEIKLFGEWGTICDRNFDGSDARVACSHMNLTSVLAEVADKESYSTGSGQIWMSNISCYGFEANFQKCKFSPVGQTSCSHSQDVGVTCKGFGTYHYKYDNSYLGVTLGASLGSAAFVFISVVIVAVIVIRFRKPPVLTPLSVHYAVPAHTGSPSTATHPPPTYPGYNGQNIEALPIKKQ